MAQIQAMIATGGTGGEDGWVIVGKVDLPMSGVEYLVGTCSTLFDAVDYSTAARYSTPEAAMVYALDLAGLPLDVLGVNVSYN